MAPKPPSTGLVVGLTKGHTVTRRELPARPSYCKGDLAGFAPYEKRITEFSKVGEDKRALKVPKREVGTHKRAKRKKRICPAYSAR